MSCRTYQKDIHEELAQTIAIRKQLYSKYNSVFSLQVSKGDVHFQLQQTIREHKAAMHHLYLRMQKNHSNQH